MAEQYERKPNIKCFMCDDMIYRRPSQIEKLGGRAFCGQGCYGLACRKEVPCLVCGKLMLAGANKKTCSRSCANVHRTGIGYHNGAPRDKVKSQRALKIRLFEQRGKTCEKCGYGGISEILQVHHKDRNRQNNELENLELICPNCHCEEHYTEKNKPKK